MLCDLGLTAQLSAAGTVLRAGQGKHNNLQCPGSGPTDPLGHLHQCWANSLKPQYSLPTADVSELPNTLQRLLLPFLEVHYSLLPQLLCIAVFLLLLISERHMDMQSLWVTTTRFRCEFTHIYERHLCSVLQKEISVWYVLKQCLLIHLTGSPGVTPMKISDQSFCMQSNQGKAQYW